MSNEFLVNKIKEKLKVKNPDISKEELETATNEILESINSKKKVDEDGHIIVAEGIKLTLNGNIITTTEVKE